MLLLGHRGARATHSVPENTIASFDLALKHGCDGFEFDVRRTADGRAVICHDAKFEGFEIAQAGPGDLPELPALAGVLTRYRESAFLDIELKVVGLEHATLHFLRSNPPVRGYVVSSFLPEVLLALHEMDAHLPLGLIAETRAQLDFWGNLPVQVVMPHYTLMSFDVIGGLHSAGRKVFTWTVNRKQDMLRFQEMGVDGIISDDTEILAQLRQECD